MTTSVLYKYLLPMGPNAEAGHVPTINGDVVGVGRDAQGARAFWVMGEPDTLTLRLVAIVGTGAELPEGTTHLGWWAEPEFGWVWHLVELAPVAAAPPSAA